MKSGFRVIDAIFCNTWLAQWRHRLNLQEKHECQDSQQKDKSPKEEETRVFTILSHSTRELTFLTQPQSCCWGFFGFFLNLKVRNRLLLTFDKFLGFAEVNKPWSTRSLKDFPVYPLKTELCKGDHRHAVYSIRLRTFAELSPPFLLANQEGPSRYSTPRAKCQIPIWNNLW